MMCPTRRSVVVSVLSGTELAEPDDDTIVNQHQHAAAE